MINCPKCQVPNPDTAAACAACGTTLVGQQFARALDQAMAQPGAPAAGQRPPPPPQVPAPSSPAPQPPAAPPLGMAEPFAPAPFGPALDPSMAQAEINRFVAEQRARRRTRSIMFFVIAAVAVGIIAFLVIRSSRKNARKEEVARFYQAFNKLDDEETGNFWKCTVRAQNIDIHKAADTLQLTDGLDKAFNNFPKTQPGWLRDKCLPRIGVIVEELDKLKAPGAFIESVDAVKAALREVKSTFERYTATIEKRKQEAADEQEIRDMHGDFHKVIEDKEAAKALAYFNVIRCAIPDLVKLARGITKPPDTQPVVERIYNTCKADPKFADKLRKDCFLARNDHTKKTGDFHLVANRMSGDARDLEAINDCFRRANKGFAREETEAVAKVFIKYAEARGKVRQEMARVKKEFSE
jgi:hypothetical protein